MKSKPGKYGRIQGRTRTSFIFFSYSVAGKHSFFFFQIIYFVFLKKHMHICLHSSQCIAKQKIPTIFEQDSIMGHKEESDSSFLQISADLPWDYVTTLHTSVSKETVTNIASSVNTEPTPTSAATNLVGHIHAQPPHW